MTDIPNWWMKGDWFDVCSCNVPCPCGFAQAPTNNRCEGVMAYHIREGAYGDVRLDGLNVIVVVTFEGNVWAKENPVPSWRSVRRFVIVLIVYHPSVRPGSRA